MTENFSIAQCEVLWYHKDAESERASSRYRDDP
ncbi:protein of unknown function [Kyrpidia spormannii]|uniref:Uncharacterized protein n=2 Tax=Kyrpidia spormannii TaxID=2055160 RepID=A0ACA8ZB95_9BACL|nr:protein of unknown function [Kyrpidia spormannii]CAB3394196.1 protein of unknown function [Kyrpidia spormannii]